MINKKIGSQHTIIPAFLSGLIMLMLLAAGCKTAKAVKVGSKKTTAESLYQQMISNQVDAEWLDSRAKISFNDEKMRISGSATIKMRKDSVIWISVKKLGFEVARAMVTSDSVYVLNRIDSEYMVKGLDFITKEYGLPASLDLLQKLMLGNPLLLTKNNLQVTSTPTAHQLSANDSQTSNEFWLDATDFRLLKTSIEDQSAERKMELVQSDYAPVTDKQNFSYLRKIALDSRETGKVDVEINFSKVEIDVPMSIRFEIPERYTRVD